MLLVCFYIQSLASLLCVFLRCVLTHWALLTCSLPLCSIVRAFGIASSCSIACLSNYKKYSLWAYIFFGFGLVCFPLMFAFRIVHTCGLVYKLYNCINTNGIVFTCGIVFACRIAYTCSISLLLFCFWCCLFLWYSFCSWFCLFPHSLQPPLSRMSTCHLKPSAVYLPAVCFLIFRANLYLYYILQTQHNTIFVFVFYSKVTYHAFLANNNAFFLFQCCSLAFLLPFRLSLSYLIQS